MTFQEELQRLINKHSAENMNNTPDFILAKYMTDCLQAFSRAVIAREQWYGYIMQPGQGDTLHRSKAGKEVGQK